MANPNAVNIYKSKFGSGLKHLGATYSNALKDMPSDFLTPEFLTPLYQQVGRNQLQQMQALRDSYGGALGSNPSGMLSRELATLAGSAPYGSANLAARQAGFSRFQQLGEGLKGLKAAESAWRGARVGERQAWEQLDLQKEALENQMFLSGQQAGGGGGFDWGSLLGLVGMIGGNILFPGAGGLVGGAAGSLVGGAI